MSATRARSSRNGPHLRRAERAVDPDDQRLGVLDRRPERVARLAGEVAAALVDGGERQPERHVGRRLARRHDRGLRVERVEDRLDQEEVDAALRERAHLLGVRLDDGVEADLPVGGVVDLRRERERDVQRPDRARDEAAVLVGHAPRDARALDVHLADGVLEPVVGLPDRGRRERVRRRHVGAGLEVGAMDRLDELGAGEVQQVGIALDVGRVVGEALAAPLLLGQPAALQQHPPGAVEHDDPLVEPGPQLFDPRRHCRSCAQREEVGTSQRFRRLVTRSPSCFSKLSGVRTVAR